MKSAALLACLFILASVQGFPTDEAVIIFEAVDHPLEEAPTNITKPSGVSIQSYGKVVELIKLIPDIANAIKTIHHMLAAERSVVVINKRAGVVRVQCASKNDVIGPRDLRPGQTLSFKFRPNIWGTTLFWCDVHAGNQKASFTAWKKGYSQVAQYTVT